MGSDPLLRIIQKAGCFSHAVLGKMSWLQKIGEYDAHGKMQNFSTPHSRGFSATSSVERVSSHAFRMTWAGWILLGGQGTVGHHVFWHGLYIK